jgi:pimeloyl-ACP methyl ester carboxylesterase
VVPLHNSDHARKLRYAADLQRMSRRSFLTGSALTLGLAGDMYVTRGIQERRKQMEILQLPDDSARRRFPEACWLLFPGFKTSWEEALWILNTLKPALHLRGQMAVVGYSNAGLNVAEIVAAVEAYVRDNGIRTLYLYGHSFGGMVAVETTAELLRRGIDVEFILLDSSPRSRFDVLDRTWFDRVVFLYEAGARIPTLVRGAYELGERVVHKNERTWPQIMDQTLEQLSPLAPSSVLIQSESSYIYHFQSQIYADYLGDTKMAFIGNPNDPTVSYGTAREGWERTFPRNMVPPYLVTEGARPAHASPQWNGRIYREVVSELLDTHFPMPSDGVRKFAQ